MSRIGNTPISIPDQATVTITDGEFRVKGEKGELVVSIPKTLSVVEKDKVLVVSRSSEEKPVKSMHGTLRALISNAIKGATEGWEKVLEVHGSGYRVAVAGQELDLQVGYSHPVKIVAPEGLEIKVVKNVIKISGADKQLVGALAAKIREVRKPEPYKGKGIKYRDEHIIRKVGKALKASE